jgi:hypothetical protein
MGLGPLPVLQTLRDKEPFYWLAGIQKRTGDCPTGRGVGIGDLVFGSDAPVLVRFASLSSFPSR